MNGKKSKALRKQAQLIATQEGIPTTTEYSDKEYTKVYVDLTGKLHGYVVYTRSMNVCTRSVYKSLKNS